MQDAASLGEYGGAEHLAVSYRTFVPSADAKLRRATRGDCHPPTPLPTHRVRFFHHPMEGHALGGDSAMSGQHFGSTRVMIEATERRSKYKDTVVCSSTTTSFRTSHQRQLKNVIAATP